MAGFIPGKTDKATFGGTWRVVLAEDEDACASIGWEPMSVDQGFKAGDNVVTVMSCTSTDSVFGVGADNVEDIMNLLADRIVDIQLYLFKITLDFPGPAVRPRILMSPGVARAIAAGGYSKRKVKQYLYEHAVFPAGRFEKLWSGRLTFREAVERGRLPQRYYESEDLARLVPIVGSPDDFMITVSGDPDRDNCLICGQNGFIGYPVSKRIELPASWQEKLKEAKTA